MIPNLEIIWVDQGYSGGNFARAIALLRTAQVEVIKWKTKEFQVLPRRWVVERTFAWLTQNRRLVVDYEQLPEMRKAMIYAAMCRLMLR
jgi:putative transposase